MSVLDYAEWVAVAGTIIGYVFTARIALINLQYVTTKAPTGGEKPLTRHGKTSRRYIISVLGLTSLVYVGQQYLSHKSQKEAEQRGNQKVVDALNKQHAAYVKELSDKFDGPIGVISRIDGATDKLKDKADEMTAVAQHSLEFATGGKNVHPKLNTEFTRQYDVFISAELVGAKDVDLFRYKLEQLTHHAPDDNALCDNSKASGASWSDETPHLQPRSGTLLGFKVPVSLDDAVYYRAVLDYKNGRYLQCLTIRPCRNGTFKMPSLQSRSAIWKEQFGSFSQNILKEEWPKCDFPGK